MLIASSQVRFRLRKSGLMMLNQVDVGLLRGHWDGALALITGVNSFTVITFTNHFNLYFLMMLLHSVAAVFLYAFSFSTILSHFAFSA